MIFSAKFRSLVKVVAVATTIAIPEKALANDVQEETQKVIANDGAAGDLFGYSVAVSGTTAIVGTYGDDDNGSYSGSAYLFNVTTGQQIAKLIPIDGAAGDWFGYSVAISGLTAIVGAKNDDDGGGSSGSAYLFDVRTGRQIAKLLASDGMWNDRFGYSVAISGKTAIVGAYGNTDAGSHTGSAYLFDVTTGQQIAKLLSSDASIEDHFGISVAISDTVAIVGAYNDDDMGAESGSAYLFDVSSGKQIGKLLPSDGTEGDYFGLSVAISGSTAIVGAAWDDESGNQIGSAYLFDVNTGQQIARLLASDGADDDFFGISVAISGASAIVGAHKDDDSGSISGSAYMFGVTSGENCPGDLNCNGQVTTTDLLELLLDWGPCDACPADLDESGAVDASDLSALLAAWGPCL